MPYSGDPATSPIDMVRFLIGDTSSTPRLTDEEIGWMLSTESSSYLAAAELCDQIAGSIINATGGSKSIGDLSLSGGEGKADHWTKKAALLRRQSYRHDGPPVPYSAGQVIADKQANDEDDSLVQPAFRVAQDDNRGGTTSTRGDDIWSY